MSISTRKGDNGTTGLLFGERVAKDHPLICANGQIDELLKALGLAKAFNPELSDIMTRLQEGLSVMMGEIATPTGKQEQFQQKGYPALGDSLLLALDQDIAQLESVLPKQLHWEWPGVHPSEAFLAFAGSVCRTTERTLVALANTDAPQVRQIHLQTLNRLSDWLHLQSRKARLSATVPLDAC